MDLVRRGNSLEIDLNDDEAIGLAAVLAGKQLDATPEQWAKGMTVYSWFFENVQTMSSNAKAGR